MFLLLWLSLQYNVKTKPVQLIKLSSLKTSCVIFSLFSLKARKLDLLLFFLSQLTKTFILCGCMCWFQEKVPCTDLQTSKITVIVGLFKVFPVCKLFDLHSSRIGTTGAWFSFFFFTFSSWHTVFNNTSLCSQCICHVD